DDLVTEIKRVLPYVAEGAALAAKMTPALEDKIRAAMGGLKDRAKTLVELIQSAHYLYGDRPLALDDKARALMTADAQGIVRSLAGILASVDPWNAATTEAAIRGFATQAEIKLGVVAQPLRAALTGRTTSPPIFDVLA